MSVLNLLFAATTFYLTNNTHFCRAKYLKAPEVHFYLQCHGLGIITAFNGYHTITQTC